MFGFLKEKLKKGIEKLTSATKKVEEEPEEAPVEAPAEAPVEEEIEEDVVEEPPKSVQKEILKEVREKDREEAEEIKEVAEEEEEKAAEDVVAKEVIREEPPATVVEMMEDVKPSEGVGILERIGLKKPKKILAKLKKVITEKVIEEDDIARTLEEMQMSLLESDVALEVAEKITADLKKSLVGKAIPKKQIETVVRDSIRNSLMEILKFPDTDVLKMAEKTKPLKIVFLGFNGTGKTTSIARMAHLLKAEGLRPVLAAGDTFRAASIEQLEEHGRRLDVPVIKHKYGADSTAVIFDAIRAAESRGYDVVLADTAGRSHSNVNLMDEMKKIIRVNKPDLKILVIDCLTGNDAVEQAKKFNEAVGVDGMILTKADVYDKGGAVLSAAWAIRKPILYMGTGQGYKDFEKFVPEKVVESLLG
ncbi:MAG: signal recognition particle-docking protein FtsY [Candidatus Aenigmatarchaeota archaeon]